MNAFEQEKNRQIIPRWLPWRASCDQIPVEALDYSVLQSIVSERQFLKTRSRWLEERSIVTASDLVLTSFLASRLDDREVLAAAGYLQSSDLDPLGTLGLAVPSVLNPATRKPRFQKHADEPPQLSVARIRAALADRVRDPLLYLDLAYAHSLLGNNTKAERSLDTALSLAPDHSLVLRSAARFFLHTARDHDPGRSLRILRKSDVVRHDPTVLGAEVAISEAFSLRSRNKKLAKLMATSKDHHPFFLSELAGTVGTLEARHGSKRRARESFTVSAACPTENALAQLEWISPKLGIDIAPAVECAVPPFEAQMYEHLHAEEYEAALSAAVDWADYQPLSSRPAITASFIASVSLERHVEAIEILERALRHSRTDFSLRNNLVFALANIGRLDQARDAANEIDTLDLRRDDEGIHWATMGLLAFREGAHEAGRALYEKAEERFRVVGDSLRLAMAKIFHAREELLAGTEEGRSMASDAVEMARSIGLRGVRALEQVERGAGGS